MSFTGTVRESHPHVLDAKADFGGQDLGPSPKEYLLSAIAGCSGMDVVSLLKKMRVEFASLNITAEAETVDTHPKIFKQVDLKFILTGENIDLEKVKKAVDMSLTKYCGVSAMVAKASPIHYEILINQELKVSGEAHFDF